MKTALVIALLALSGCVPLDPEDLPELKFDGGLVLHGCTNPADIVVDNGTYYIACSGTPGQSDGVLFIVNPELETHTEHVVGGFPVSVAVSGQLVLLGDGGGGGRLYATRVSGTVLADADSPHTLCPAPYTDTVTALHAHEGRVVAGCGGGSVIRFEAADVGGELEVTVIDQTRGALGIASFAQWTSTRAVTADRSSPTLSLVELGSTLALEQRWDVPAGPEDVAVRGDLAVVASLLGGRVVGVDLSTDETVFSSALLETTEGPGSVAFFDDDTVAVGLENAGTVVAVDTHSGEMLGAAHLLGAAPTALRPAGDGKVLAIVDAEGGVGFFTIEGPG